MRVVWLLCSSLLWPTVAVNCNGNANWLGLLGGNAARLVCSLSFYLWPAVAASASVLLLFLLFLSWCQLLIIVSISKKKNHLKFSGSLNGE